MTTRSSAGFGYSLSIFDRVKAEDIDISIFIYSLHKS
ncbi:hypothetical protein B6N60_00831 [Richelia sinica FACHB-800]|uniref:Uncharacterized protein n=1 Tax=Richelia sinica FACHB-800 TaxID=1357546 RepID=A0A975T4X6_9NOST|nr:hypothetical protein B6N60_00831 [Richelia sinica FACHB-800]